ncbi:MAG: DsbA family protein [Actinomycetota bacterium]|nr:DsbA family protein [Actinomycetota bacterium]
MERYVEYGTVRYEWRDFAYLGQESVNAALAARAAQEQGRFWEYHDVLYENQGSVNSGAFSDEALVGFAEEVGLDTGQFEAALASGRYESVVQSDLREAQNAGIQGTPSFTINGQRLVGPQPLEAFDELIEAELTKAGG